MTDGQGSLYQNEIDEAIAKVWEIPHVRMKRHASYKSTCVVCTTLIFGCAQDKTTLYNAAHFLHH